MNLVGFVSALKARYGRPEPLPTTDPWELIVWENIVYLADDEQRTRAFSELRKKIGLRAADIRACRAENLVRIASGKGILPDNCAEKLKDAAEVAEDRWKGDLKQILKRPFREAKKALKEFPGIGDPGAEKILLFTGTHPFLALDSNGLRVLLRLGYGKEKGAYSAMYKSVREDVEKESPREFTWLIEAHQLLRRHGRETCRRTVPLCEACPLARDCSFHTVHRGRRAGAG